VTKTAIATRHAGLLLRGGSKVRSRAVTAVNVAMNTFVLLLILWMLP